MEAENKVWLITGSSRGIGRALSEAVLEKGDLVIATARKVSDLDSLKKMHADKVTIMQLDVTDENNATGVIESVIKNFGRIDVLVNNAGYGNLNSIEETAIDDFRAQIETNLFGTIILTKAVLPHMRQRRSGHIVQFSSVGGRIGPIGRGPYAAAKWGVEGFSETLSREAGPLGVKVTIIEPGGFRTDFAGSSSEITENGLSDYADTVGKIANFQQEYNGKQPGDPKKAAQAIIKVVYSPEPPLRLLLGSDAIKAVEVNDQEKLKQLDKWRELSISTDF